MLLGTGSNIVEYAPWSLNSQNQTQQNIQDIQTTYAAVINILQRKQQILFLDCIISAFTSSQKSIIQLQPLNRLYPLIDCVNTGTQIFDRTQIIKVKVNVEDWLKQLQNPPGEIVSLEGKIEVKNLDQMAEFALSSAGMNYNWKQKLQPNDGAYQIIQDLNYQFCQEMNLQYHQTFELCQYSLSDVDNLIKQIRCNWKADNRQDLMDETVFTIDPDTAKDFDDACSVSVKLTNGQILTAYQYCQLKQQPEIQSYLIGVHIADVTHFTTQAGEDNQLIKAARDTTTSVYFADRCCPMYPYELADGLASLNPAVPRYVFSVIFEMDKNGLLVPQTVKFTKGLIVSKCRLDYVAAQAILNNDQLDIKETTINGWPICKGYHKAIIFSTKVLNNLALKLRKQRDNAGALQINNSEIRYGISSDMTVTIKEPEDAPFAHHLIEEFMIVTNCLVSIRLLQTFPCCPVLRQHSPPQKEYPYNFQLKQLNCPQINIQQPKQLSISLQKLATALQSHNPQLKYKPYQYQNLANTTFLSSSLVRAVYICGMSDNEIELAHWGIHAQSYMHFTSPIRRYADDVCHLMLNEALIWEKEDERSNIYNNLQPHKLIIEEPLNIYSNSCDFMPQGYLRHLSSKMFPVSNNTKQEIENKQLKQQQTLQDIVEGNEQTLNFNMRDNMKLKQKFQQLIKAAIQGEDVENMYQHEKQEKKDKPIDENCEEYQLIQRINQRLEQRLKLPIQMIKTLIQRCNAMAIQTDNACKVHQQIVLNYFVQNSPNQEIQTYCFLVKIDKLCLFFVPEYSLSFALQNKDKDQKDATTTGQVQFNINLQEPLNKQNNEGSKQYIFEFLKPIKICMKPSKCPIDGVELWLTK